MEFIRENIYSFCASANVFFFSFITVFAPSAAGLLKVKRYPIMRFKNSTGRQAKKTQKKTAASPTSLNSSPLQAVVKKTT